MIGVLDCKGGGGCQVKMAAYSWSCYVEYVLEILSASQFTKQAVSTTQNLGYHYGILPQNKYSHG